MTEEVKKEEMRIKTEAEVKIKDKDGKEKTLSEINDKVYKKTTKEETITKAHSYNKEKIIIRRTYPNGVVKNTLKEVKKEGIPLRERNKKAKEKMMGR